jgi:toxin FitB
MIILDTNVVSEPMRPRGDPAVRAWLDQQAADTLYLTATNLAELLVGIELLPAGRRRRGLYEDLRTLLAQLFGARILPFDAEAAAMYATVVRRARSAGQALSVADAQIAAIAAVHGFMVATRDVRPFTAAGVPVVNPWGG